MLCEKCGVNNATTHIRTLVKGEIFEKHLCSSCAINEGYGNIKHNSLSQILSTMFDDSANIAVKSSIAHCECCGTTFNDIVKSGKCGCHKCYETFYEQLLPYIKKAQYGRTAHSGKMPHDEIVARKTIKEKITELKTLLNKLVSLEQYEEAALIRDRIKSLEEEAQ